MVRRDLWTGAEVRWVGPGSTRKGVRLRFGDRAVVVNAGAHHVTSFGGLRREGVPPPEPPGGVTIRLEGDGAEVTVPRRHLEIVAPEHPLSPEPDGSAADWWLGQLPPWGPEQGVPVASLVPRSFPAVAQVLHPWWGHPPPDGRPVTWAELAREHGFASVGELAQTLQWDTHSLPAAEASGLHAVEGRLDRFTASALVDVLGDMTETADDVFVAVWTGWGDVPPQRFPGAAHLATHKRGHFLLRGPLTGVLTSVSASSVFDSPVAGLWWPADRAWFVATEIDDQWTFVAGAQALVDRLIDDQRLEAARTNFDASANEVAEPA
jgi:hypothetical protein